MGREEEVGGGFLRWRPKSRAVWEREVNESVTCVVGAQGNKL